MVKIQSKNIHFKYNICPRCKKKGWYERYTSYIKDYEIKKSLIWKEWQKELKGGIGITLCKLCHNII